MLLFVGLVAQRHVLLVRLGGGDAFLGALDGLLRWSGVRLMLGQLGIHSGLGLFSFRAICQRAADVVLHLLELLRRPGWWLILGINGLHAGFGGSASAGTRLRLSSRRAGRCRRTDDAEGPRRPRPPAQSNLELVCPRPPQYPPEFPVTG